MNRKIQVLIATSTVAWGVNFPTHLVVIKGTELLLNNPSPSDNEIRSAMNGHLCRCGTYPKILCAIRKAADNQQTAVLSEAQEEDIV